MGVKVIIESQEEYEERYLGDDKEVVNFVKPNGEVVSMVIEPPLIGDGFRDETGAYLVMERNHVMRKGTYYMEIILRGLEV